MMSPKKGKARRMKDPELLAMYTKSLDYYESVGDDLVRRGRDVDALRAYEHALGDACRIPAAGGNFLVPYKRIFRKRLDIIERLPQDLLATL